MSVFSHEPLHEGQERRRFEGKRFSGFLQKPYSSARLVEAVAQCLTPAVRKARGV